MAGPNFETRVAQYVQLRDKIADIEKRHKEELRPFKEMQELLNAALLQHMVSSKAESVRTSAGTVYRSSKGSASIADHKAFWAFVENNGAWDLLDKKANVTAVRDYIEENKNPPPGITYTERQTVGVRRS